MNKQHLINIFILIFLSSFFIYYNIRGTLPDKTNTLTPVVDEITWLDCLKNMKPSELNFDPGYYVSGSFIPYMLGAGLKISESLGIIKLINDEDYYFKNINEWAKIYLVGRILNTFYFLLLLIGVYFIIFNISSNKLISFLSAFIISFLPEMAIQSKIITSNVAVTAFTIWTIFFYLKIYDDKHVKWYIFAGIFTGLAYATKYSSLPLPALLFLILLIKNKSLKFLTNKNIYIYFFSCVICFAIINPYFFLEFDKIIFTVNKYSKVFNMVNSKTSPGFTFWLPLTITFNYSIGLPLLLFSYIGIFFCLIKGSIKERFLIFWILLFYIFLAKANDKAFVGRDTLISVFFPYFALKTLFIFPKNKIYKYLLIPFLICAALYSMMYNIAILLSLENKKQVRNVSSAWIDNNIPENATIGLVREPYWYHPTILYNEFWHNNDIFYKKNKYKLILFDYKVDKFKNSLPDYVVLSARAISYRYYGTSTKEKDWKDFAIFFLNDKRYKLIKTFPRRIRFIFDFSGKETARFVPYITFPLYYQSSVYIYKKIEQFN